MSAPKKPRARAAAPAPYHHGDLRRALLDTSVALVAEHGVEALSLREVARAAGVSPAAPYHHFASKAELLGAIAARGFVGLARAMHEALGALPDPDAPLERLAAIGEAYVAFARAHPTEFRLMFRPSLVDRAALPPDCDPEASFALLLDAVARVAGVVPPEVVKPEVLTLVAWSLVHGLAELVLDGPLEAMQRRLGVPLDAMGPLVVGALPNLLRAAMGAGAHAV